MVHAIAAAFKHQRGYSDSSLPCSGRTRARPPPCAFPGLSWVRSLLRFTMCAMTNCGLWLDSDSLSPIRVDRNTEVSPPQEGAGHGDSLSQQAWRNTSQVAGLFLWWPTLSGCERRSMKDLKRGLCVQGTANLSFDWGQEPPGDPVLKSSDAIARAGPLLNSSCLLLRSQGSEVPGRVAGSPRVT